MKRNHVRLDAMHFCFRLGEQIEDRERMLFYVATEERAVEFDANIGPRRVKRLMFVSVHVLVTGASLVAMQGLSLGASQSPHSRRAGSHPISSDKKSTSGEGMIAMRRKSALSLLTKFQGCNRRLHTRPMLRESVEESRDEHVA